MMKLNQSKVLCSKNKEGIRMTSVQLYRPAEESLEESDCEEDLEILISTIL